ncbi:MAG TPA: hypothetical protein VFU56_09340 [Gaiellaceae bacterium]|nr:hypothetical protein [Gaiellaceae bacterium]
MHPDVLITIVFAGFVALVALAAGVVLLRSRLHDRSAEEAEREPVAPAR